MKYQLIKHNKGGVKLEGLFASMNEATTAAKMKGKYTGNSYMGGFPIFEDEKQKLYSIQGLADCGIVCSIPEEEMAELIGK